MSRKTPLNKEAVRRMAACGCTDAEIATICDCAETTIKRHCRMELTQGRARLNMSVRRTQIRMMRKGSAAMAIWLGKQILGQADKQEISEHGGTLRIVERIEPAGGESGSDHGPPDAPAT